MREVVLGHWQDFLWHVPAVAFMAGMLAVAARGLRELRRDSLGDGERSRRWLRVGYAALAGALVSVVVVPYASRVASLEVLADGRWVLRNYAGLAVSEIAPDSVRELRALDLNGFGVGVGHLEITVADGRSFRTVRVGRETLNEALATLGYRRELVAQEYTDTVVRAHRYGPAGAVALRAFIPTPVAQTARVR